MMDITDPRLAPYVDRAERIYGPGETANYVLILSEANGRYNSRPAFLRKIDLMLWSWKKKRQNA